MTSQKQRNFVDGQLTMRFNWRFDNEADKHRAPKFAVVYLNIINNRILFYFFEPTLTTPNITS